jgi:hypothetical protein
VTKNTLFGIGVKANQPAQTIVSPNTNDPTTSYVSRGGPSWADRQHHIGPIYHVLRCQNHPQPLFVTNYALVGMVAKANQPAQTIVSPTIDTTTSYVSRGGPILGWPQAQQWAFISCVWLSKPSSTTASDQLCFV